MRCHIITQNIWHVTSARHPAMAADTSSGEPPYLPAALAFFRAFPEVTSYHVLVLNAEKRAVVSLPQASAESVCLNVMEMEKVHVFVRPNLANLVMVDADNYGGDLATIFALKPRCLTETSPGNYQLWLVLGKHLTGKAALQVTKDLSRALGADGFSQDNPGWQAPGSVNVKPGKGNQSPFCTRACRTWTSRSTCDWSQTLLSLLVILVLRFALCLLANQQADWTAASLTGLWPAASSKAQLEEARRLLAGRFQAQTPNQAYYEDLTLRNAFEHVRGQDAQKAGSPPCPAASRPAHSLQGPQGS